MRCFRLVLAALVLVAAPLLAQQTRPIDPANLDTTCAPCQDFYRFANGGWLARATLPGDEPRWGSFNELRDKSLVDLREVLEASTRPGADPKYRKAGDYYASCMDTVAIASLGTKPIDPELKAIAAVTDRKSVEAAIARLQKLGVSVPFSIGAAADAKNSNRMIVSAGPGGALGLPDREYYFRQDSTAKAIRVEYRTHIATLLGLTGDAPGAAAAAADSVIALETALAKAQLTRVERRNPDSTYHLMPLAQAEIVAPQLGWSRFFSAAGIAAPAELNVTQPRYLHAADSLLSALPTSTWRSYLRWHLLNTTAPRLSPPFETEAFRFRQTVLTGVKQMQPRWKRCIRATDAALGELVGEAYVRRHFTPEAKARALAMVKNIQAEFRARLANVGWMTDVTKQRAYAKLDAITNKIGYPDKWRDYSRLHVVRGPYVTNALAAGAFERQRQLDKLGKPVDKSEWGMTPPTVNASYNPSRNDVTFPAAIMQPPFFDPNADDAVNYGGMGAVIGHEITHGFDDEGRKYDAQGNLSGWWQPADDQAFTERADRVVRQFDGFTPIDTMHVNGKLTLGENLADLGGLTIAYGAYMRSLAGRQPPTIDGLTGPQRFFLGWAQIWREVTTPEYTRQLLLTDPHSPGRYRTIGPVSNMPAFAEAFGCKSGDPMVAPPEKQASIW